MDILFLNFCIFFYCYFPFQIRNKWVSHYICLFVLHKTTKKKKQKSTHTLNISYAHNKMFNVYSSTSLKFMDTKKTAFISHPPSNTQPPSQRATILHISNVNSWQQLFKIKNHMKLHGRNFSRVQKESKERGK